VPASQADAAELRSVPAKRRLAKRAAVGLTSKE